MGVIEGVLSGNLIDDGGENVKCKSVSKDTQLIKKHTLTVEVDGYSIKLEVMEPLPATDGEKPRHLEFYDLVGCEFPGIDITGCVYTAQITPDNLEHWLGINIIEDVTNIDLLYSEESNTQMCITMAKSTVKVVVERVGEEDVRRNA